MPYTPDSRIKKLIEDGDKLFSNRLSLDSLWQEMALQFYPEMATFTTTRNIGEEFVQHLTTSYPLIARRTLGDSLGALLRPTNLDTTSPGVWFSASARRGDKEMDHAAKVWLESRTGIMRRAMYDRAARFVRATKEGDHCFATFGQTPITVELNRAGNVLLYRNWHLRDVVWAEDATGEIGEVHRRWKPTAQQLVDTFGANVSPKVREKISNDDRFGEVECRHIVIAAERYEQRDAAGKKFRTPWVSIWIDKTNDYVMEEVGSASRIYVIPRWVTIPGVQYASSPAVTAALPDARLMQAMALTLQETGEKFADPPTVAVKNVLRSTIDTFAGGVTWIDQEYDQRTGKALETLYEPTAAQGLGVALQMYGDVREMIAKAFFLDSLSLPPASSNEMTAFEVGERISEWIRRAMPIFEPMEFEYNGALCEATFDLLLRNGGFGPFEDIPASLRGNEVQFRFESPLHESDDRKKGQKFLEAQALLAQAAQLDPTVLPMLDARKSLRDALSAVVPTDWTRDDAAMDEILAEQQAAKAAQEMLAGAGQAAVVAKDLGAASKDFAGAQAA